MNAMTSDAAIESLIAGVSGNPMAMLNLARTLLIPKGKDDRARELCEQAVALAPNDPEVQSHAYAIRSYGIGSWYYTMVQDVGRHELYAKAFRRLLKPGCTVLDIGAGTGLFAMLAAREGAGKVVACERHPAVAEAARAIVALNGYADRVTIVTKDSRGIEVGVELDEPADVLLWDNLANNLLGAGGADTIEDARRRLLKPDAVIIPGRAEIRVALVEDLSPQDRIMTTADGFDMSPFNKLRATNFTVKRAEFARRSDAATAFDIDFQSGAPITEAVQDVTVTATGGLVHGILQWVRFHVSPDELYDTGDDEGVTAFGLQFHPVEPFEARPGEQITVRGSHDRTLTWFWVSDR